MADVWSFGFVDLAGFTALTEAHGDDVAAEQVARFLELAQQASAGTAWVVKSIGDAVMLAAEQAGDAVLTSIALLQACCEEPQFPLARGGVHAGTAVRAGQDFLGTGVNVAARITARAAGGQLVLTKETAAAARQHGYHVHELGEVILRNLSEPVELFSVDLGPAEHTLDPVCRMTVDKHAAAGTLSYAGHEFWFCSLQCAGAFAANPTRHHGAITEPR